VDARCKCDDVRTYVRTRRSIWSRRPSRLSGGGGGGGGACVWRP
jgi:hypothetical protein